MEKSEADISKQWEDYKLKFKKDYPDAEEEERRKGLFVKSLQFIEEHNEKYRKGEITYQCGINQFSDLTEDERSSRCGGLKKKP